MTANKNGDCLRSADDSTSGPARPSDEEILRHLGAAVLLCWDQLPFKSRERILAQANDMIGLTPIPDVRNEIVALLLRRTDVRDRTGIGAITKAID